MKGRATPSTGTFRALKGFLTMKYAIVAGSVMLFCLALAPTGDAQGKKKDPNDQVPPRADEVPKYLKMLSAGNSKDRALAADKIGLRGAVNFMDVKDAIEPLKKMLDMDADALVRSAAARALGNIQPDAKETVPLLTRTVKDDKVKEVRLSATTALGQYGADAKESLPVLREFAKEFADKKKAPEGQIIQAAIKSISGKKK
jgi:HEAT repeat protein